MATVIDQTLGDFAQSAIAKYLKQATQYEKGVLIDVDPEDLHQMRVGMRRLQSAQGWSGGQGC
jgi:CHAD domain-containing protein